MSEESIEIRGTIDRVVFQDARFRVVALTGDVVDSGDPVSVSVSGDSFGPIYPGMSVHYRVRRARSPIYGERGYVQQRLDIPSDRDTRSAGVWAYLSHGGLPTLAHSADVLSRHYTSALAEVLVEDLQRLAELQAFSQEELAVILPQLATHHSALQSSASLGVLGLDWAIEPILHSDMGRNGPELVMVDPFQLVRYRIASYSDAMSLADHLGLSRNDRLRIIGAGDALRHDLYRNREVATSASTASRRLNQYLGDGVSGVLNHLIEQGHWTRRDDVVAPTGVFIGADALVDGLARLDQHGVAHTVERIHISNLDESATAVVNESLSNGVTLVVAPDGARYEWVSHLTGFCASLGLGLAITAADRRGALYGLHPPVLVDHPSPDVVVVLDAHRMSHVGLVRVLAPLRDGAHVVLVGDDWLWNPAKGGHPFGDLVDQHQYRTVHLTGYGPAWEFRRLGMAPQGSPRLRIADQDNSVPLVQWREPSAPRRKAGQQVMAAENLPGGVGVGATGEILGYDQGSWLVQFHGLGTHEVTGASKLCSFEKVPVHLLPGICMQDLALAVESRWTRHEIYAAMCAARRELRVAEPEVLVPRKPIPRINPLEAARSALWVPIVES